MSTATKIQFGERSIEYDLGFSDRGTLAIHVNPDRSVSVVAPHSTPVDDIHERVQRRAPWIVKQQDYFEEFHPLPSPPAFVSGETHLFLGRQYRLKVRQADESSVKLLGGHIHVAVPDKNDATAIEAYLDDWYRKRAADNFAKRLEACIANAKSLSLGSPGFSIRKMKRRWGSCTKSGRILLNLQLIKTPGYCIEYVIMHELCHLKIHNHGPEYYQLLSRCMPDWERRKRRLSSFIV